MVNYAQYISTALMTTKGDLIYEDATPAAARLAVGATGQVLTVEGGVPAWTSPGNFQATDQGLVAWSFDPVAIAAGFTLTPAGTLFTVKVHNQVAQNVTNIIVDLTTAGGTLTSGQCFAALFQGVGGALLGTTADQSGAWAGATGVKTMAISGGPVAAAAGDLIIGFWYNGTTGPSFGRGTQNPTANVGLAAAQSRFGTANTGLTTTAPGTLGTIAALTASIWAGLS
jgi:hypothetical protein